MAHEFTKALIEKRSAPRVAIGERTALQERPSVDEALAEGVDFSEGGWATDMAASLLGLLLFVSSLAYYHEEDRHLTYMYAGTSIAHFFGGLAHRYFPNRASDGIGQRGFYLTMLLGYSGNCMRYGLGWGLGGLFPWLALLNVVYLIVTLVNVLSKMTHTENAVDSSEETFFKPDTIFGYGELFCAVMEVGATIYFIIKTPYNLFVIIGGLTNLLGWIAVYVPGILYVVSNGQFDYDPSLMQRVFHYSMIAMMWALDASTHESCP